jgi:acyl-CoA thioesterase
LTDDYLDPYRAQVAKDPYAARLGMEVLEVRPGYAKVKMTLDPDHQNFFGFVHGGAIFSLLDQPFAIASNSHNESAVAINMSISFIAAPERSGVLVAEGKEIDKSRKLGLYELTARDESGKLIAKCEGRVYRIGKPVVE